MNNKARALANFTRDVADHKVSVMHDDGIYRHLRLADPKNSMHWYEIITTPGQLTIRGDMGTYVFAREQDMFDFFVDDRRAGNWINPGYWAEKLEAIDRTTPPREYDADVAERVISEAAAQLREDEGFDHDLSFSRWRDDLVALVDTAEDESDLRAQLARSSYNGHKLYDDELDFSDYSYRFIWCLHAIVFGIKSYRAWSSIKPIEQADERIAEDRRKHDEGRGARVTTWAGGNR